MSTEVTFDEQLDNLAPEAVTSLEGFDEEPGGAWDKGWYSGQIIEGFSTRSGKVCTTTEGPSAKGDSRNLRFAVKVTGPRGDRNLMDTINYRVGDFTPATIARIKQARVEFAQVRGAWPDKDAQRTNLALVRIHGLEKASGQARKVTPDGTLLTAPFVGLKLDVYLSIDEKGYNEVKSFAQAGTKVKA